MKRTAKKGVGSKVRKRDFEGDTSSRWSPGEQSKTAMPGFLRGRAVGKPKGGISPTQADLYPVIAAPKGGKEQLGFLPAGATP